MKRIYMGIVILLILCIPISAFAEGNDYSTTGQAGFYGVYEPETSTDSSASSTTPDTRPNQTTPSVGSQQVNSEGFGILPSTGSDVGYTVSCVGFALLLGVFKLLYQIRNKEEMK